MSEKKLQGTFGSGILFCTDNEATAVDSYALHQLKNLLDNEASKNSRIRVMPDVHPGKVCTIGLTMSVANRVIPEIVGIDIGCGLSIAKLKLVRPEFQKLDTVIRERVPSGFNKRKEIHRRAVEIDLTCMVCWSKLRKNEDGSARALLGLGTLGGGNHFIEVDRDDEKNAYLIIHSGSRHLGCEVSDYYLKEGHKILKERGEDVPYEMTYLEGELMEDYIHDIGIVKDFAFLNRSIMIDEICRGMKWKVEDEWTCCHNYIDFCHELNCRILRKGAISARKDERVIIPINMRDGVILGKGRGNEYWNCSAPHGSGRIQKREEVKKTHTVSEFKSAMKGIYSSCVGKSTLDEAPFAYRPISEILESIEETVSVEKIIRPVYNFKAGGEE